MSEQNQYIRWFSELTINDIPLVGGKNASLGEMYRELASEGVIVPNGFAITAEAYRYMLDQAGAWPHLHELLDHIDADDVADLAGKCPICVFAKWLYRAFFVLQCCHLCCKIAKLVIRHMQ